MRSGPSSCLAWSLDMLEGPPSAVEIQEEPTPITARIDDRQPRDSVIAHNARELLVTGLTGSLAASRHDVKILFKKRNRSSMVRTTHVLVTLAAELLVIPDDSFEEIDQDVARERAGNALANLHFLPRA